MKNGLSEFRLCTVPLPCVENVPHHQRAAMVIGNAAAAISAAEALKRLIITTNGPFINLFAIMVGFHSHWAARITRLHHRLHP